MLGFLACTKRMCVGKITGWIVGKKEEEKW